jgi:hypothetical protein
VENSLAWFLASTRGDYMELLSGWKEIAEHLHLGVRTAQRWERLGLPVRRVSDSPCSPVVALPDELELWARTRNIREDATLLASNRFLVTRLSDLREEHFQTRRKTKRLLAQITSLADKQKELLNSIQANLSPRRIAESKYEQPKAETCARTRRLHPRKPLAIHPSTQARTLSANW